MSDTYMHHLSYELLRVCKIYAEGAKNEPLKSRVKFSNIPNLFVSPSVIEACFNEFVSYGITTKAHDFDGVSSKVFDAMKGIEKSEFEKKWNVLSAALGGELWDKSIEPFSSFHAIKSVRNNMVHYKGDFCEPGKGPTSYINGLLNRFCTELELKNPNTMWTLGLLGSPDFGEWVYERTKAFYEQVPKLLNAEKAGHFKPMFEPWECDHAYMRRGGAKS